MATIAKHESMTLENQQFLSMAIAYLEIGKVAAEAGSKFSSDVDYQNAVAYQLFHAVELFYKLMIKNKTGSVYHIHDLRKLEEEYTNIYPGPNHKVNHPFDFSDYSSCELNPGEDEMYAELISRFKPKYMDQHLRYPTNTRTGGYSFSLDSSVFEEIKNTMIEIYELSS
jgi:hypothetical protein